MNLRWKDLVIVALVCALTTTLFGSAVVYSAPRTGTVGPLGTNYGYTDLIVQRFNSNTTTIPIEGYRQVTISIFEVTGSLTADVFLHMFVQIASSNMIMLDETFTTGFDSVGRTYPVEGNVLSVIIMDRTGNTQTVYRVIWYLTA